MGPKTFLAALMCLIIVALMCSPIFLVWHGFTMGGSVIVRIAFIVIGLILLRLFKPISNLTGKDYKILIVSTIKATNLIEGGITLFSVIPPSFVWHSYQE